MSFDSCFKAYQSFPIAGHFYYLPIYPPSCRQCPTWGGGGWPAFFSGICEWQVGIWREVLWRAESKVERDKHYTEAEIASDWLLMWIQLKLVPGLARVIPLLMFSLQSHQKQCVSLKSVRWEPQLMWERRSLSFVSYHTTAQNWKVEYQLLNWKKTKPPLSRDRNAYWVQNSSYREVASGQCSTNEHWMVCANSNTGDKGIESP